MTTKNFLSKIRGLFSASQSTDVSLDCRLTVGSPSGLDAKWKQNPFMRFAVVLTLIFSIGVGNAWAVDYEYQMITAASQMTAGTYVVGALRSTTATNNFYFGKATVSSGDWVVSDSYVTVAESNGVRKFDATSLPTGAVEFTFTGNNTDGFTIANGSNYLYYTANNTRKLAFASSGSTYKWTVADKSSPLITGGVCLKKKTGGTASNYTISENATGTGAIRGYNTTTVYRGIYLFKKQEKSGGSTPSLSATPTSLDWGTVNKGAGLTTKTFTISGSNLTGNLSVATTGSYTVDCGASITVTSGSPTVTTITVTAPSTATAGTKNGTITISGGGASSVAISCSLTVNEIDQFIDEVQSTAGYTSASPHIEGGTYSTPSLTDKSEATSGTCEQLHYHFVGWITKAKYDAGTSIAVGDLQTPTTATGATYYAVWAKQAAGGSSNTITLTYSDFGYTSTTYSEKTCTKGGIGFTCNQGCRGTSPYSLQMNSSKGTGSLYNTTAITGLQSVTLKCNANNASKTATVYQGASSNPTSTSAGTAACAASTNYTINITSGSYFTVKVGGATYFSEVVIAYSTVTYEDYIAKCCTQLGSLNGSFW